MYRDFDDFEDEFAHIRQEHHDSLDHDQYGDDYDPNAELFYDLDVFSLDYAKTLFQALGGRARYKGFNNVGHKCEQGVKQGCNSEQSKRYEEVIEKINDAYGNKPLNLFSLDYCESSIDPEIIAMEEELSELRERCLFGSCEPCTEEEYEEYLKIHQGSEFDDPHDLYHPNNQTILDASTMPDVPVDPQIFLTKVTSELASNKVVISRDMPTVLEQMCRLFNFSIKPNQALPRTVKNLVFPAQTGIGKSVSVQVYVSMLEQHSSMIVVSKVEEAINYCQYINQLSGDKDYARCYYSLTDKNKDNPMRVDAAKLKKHRCIVITHNMFRRVNGFDNIDYFGTYQEKPRDFISIDEKLSFYEHYKLGYKELDQLISNVEEALEQSKQLDELITSHEVLRVLKSFKDFLLFKDDKIITDSNSVVMKDFFVSKVQDELLAIGEVVTLSEYSQQNKYPMKLVGLKDKKAVLKLLQSSHIATQIRKRKVIGVSFKDVFGVACDQLAELDSFYCEKLDSLLGSCRPCPSWDNPDDPRTDLLSDEYDKEYSDNVFELREQQLAKDEKEGVFHAKGLELATLILKAMLEVRVDELMSSLEALGANKNPNYRQNALSKINELLDALQYFSTNHFLIYKTNYEKALLATENLTNRLGLSVVLDATATINEYYQLANRFLGHVGFVKAPQIRQYQNLTINKAIGFNQSRSAIYRGKKPEELKSVAKSYASYILNELDKDDKMLLICHKDFTSTIKKQLNDQRVEYTHWGNHVGRNDWSQCNKVMLIGWNYLNQIQHVSTINSSLESILLTSRHLDDELIEKFSISQLADDIIQGLMRSQARVIATDESDCKETSFYLFYNDDDMSKKVVELVESQFPKANVVDWTPSGIAVPKKKTKPNKKADSIIELLVEKAKDHETYLRKGVESDLGIDPATMGRIIKDDYFKDLLAEQGFSFKNKDGKSQQFILK